jgi:integrase/recombinase XerC
LKKLATRAAAIETWGDTHRANVLQTVGALLKWAGREVKIPHPPKASKGAESVVPDPVYRKCLLGSHGDFHQLLRMLWLTGCRPGEASGLTVEAIDWSSATATLKRHKTRRKGKTRILFLGSEVLAVLQEQREKYGAGLLFRGLRGKRLGLQALTMRFQRLSERIGCKVTSYQFRHTWATRALLAGIADVEVAAMLGHSSTAMLHRHYAHITSNSRKMIENANRLAG